MFRVLSNSLIRVSSHLQKMPPANKRVVGRMFSLQDSLPRLPVPALDKTIQKYLRTVEPLLTEEEFTQTKKVAQDFLKDPGPKLQQFLQRRANTEKNWLSDWWKQTAYLEVRCPVVVNVSPGVVFPKQDYNTKEGQLRFTAKLIAGVLDYKVQIDNKTLPVERLGGQPLCMTQYFKILSACRVPGKKHDDWHCYPSDKPNAPSHVTIVHNNSFFSLECYGSSKKPLTERQIYKQLKKIVEMSKTAAEPIGLLTTENRNTWAKSYHKLTKDIENKASLVDIQRSILVVCIDNKLPQDLSDERSVAARMMLHGGGCEYNSGNRWFDKTLQFIVCPNGICGLNYEHTTAEGPPIISIVDHVMEYCKKYNPEGVTEADAPEKHILSKKKQQNNSAVDSLDPPRKLKFNISDGIRKDIEEAKQSMDSLVQDTDLTIFEFTEYGKNFPKSQKLSPDSFIQIAFQLAYYRLHNEPCATYETASLRKFQLGRTDTIRSCSNESLEFCKAMQDSSKTKEEKAALLKKAVTAHKNYVNEAVNGEGVDRHLLGLKLAAIESGLNVPDLHMDTAFTASTYFRLSTSQVPAKAEAVLVFGPVVPDGYGLCYNPQETQILIGVSAYNNSPQTDSKRMITALQNSFRDMRDILAGSLQAKL